MTAHLSANDYERSWTSYTIDSVTDTLVTSLDGGVVRRILDVGCGYGGIAATLRDALGADEVHGVDIDPGIVEEARAKGVWASRVDIAQEPLPYRDGSFDLVTCFGMLDYLPWFDTALVEVSRVLQRSGRVAVVLPNLASWHNRLALLLGYQPRDIEFCSVRAVGLAPFYESTVPVGHLHTATVRAFREFMELMGFRTCAVAGLRRATPAPAALRLADWALARRPTLSRRFLYVGEKVDEPELATGDGWWRSDPG